MATKKKKKQSVNKNKSSVLAISLKTLLNVLLTLLFIASLFMIAFAIAYFRNPPETVKTAYADTLTYAQEDENGDKPYPIEVNVFTNERNNGTPCYEIRLNYYTDVNIPENEEDYKNVYSSGYQTVNEKIQWKLETDVQLFSWRTNWYKTITNGYYYNSVNGESYKAINELDYSDKWIFDYGNGQGLMLVSSKGFFEHTPGTGVFGYTWWWHHDINEFLVDIFDIVELMEDGTYILPFDISEYFNYKIYDSEQKKFIDEQADNKWLFFQMKITKNSNGLVSSNQSLFGQIANNSHYGYDGVDNADYYRSMTIYNLTENDFIINATIINGNIYNLATLKTSANNFLNNFSRMYIRVVFDMDKYNYLNLGFSEQAFKDVDVNDIVISSTETTDFYNFSNKQIGVNGNITVYSGGDI